MSRKAKAFVLDTWAVIAYLEDEPAGEQVEELIASAHEQDIPLQMSVVNVSEVWYIIARETSETDADASVNELKNLGIEFIDVDWKIAREAGHFKSMHKMSLGDCYAAALAKEMKADLVTGDKEFQQVDGQVKVHWI